MKKFFSFVAAAFVALTMNAEALTVAEAYEIGMALDSLGVSETEYTVEGYVINAMSFSTQHMNQSWYMADSANATASDFEAYNCYPIQGTDTLKVLNGDKVSVTGKLKKYYNKNAQKFIIEFEKANATFITMTDGDHTVDKGVEVISIAKALEIGGTLASGASTEKMYKLTGIITALTNNKGVANEDGGYAQYNGSQNFWLAPEGSTATSNADGAFFVYAGVGEEQLYIGYTVSLTVSIKNYNGMIENGNAKPAVTILSQGETPVDDADVVFTSAEFNGLGTSGSGSEVNVVKDGVTFNCNKAYGDQYGVRCYKNSVVTITSAEQQIGKIVFEFATVSGTYYNGDLEEEIVVNGMSWTNTMTNQARMNKISIYFGEYEKPEPATVDTITVAQAMEIGNALEAGATTNVEYVVAGWVVQAYAPNEGYTDQTWFMADEFGAYGEFEAYRCTPDYLVENDQFVYVKGKISKYVNQDGSKTTIEIKNGTATHLWGQGIENVELTEKAQKVVVDGVIYIVRDNKMFNLQGAQVR